MWTDRILSSSQVPMSFFPTWNTCKYSSMHSSIISSISYYGRMADNFRPGNWLFFPSLFFVALLATLCFFYIAVVLICFHKFLEFYISFLRAFFSCILNFFQYFTAWFLISTHCLCSFKHRPYIGGRLILHYFLSIAPLHRFVMLRGELSHLEDGAFFAAYWKLGFGKQGHGRFMPFRLKLVAAPQFSVVLWWAARFSPRCFGTLVRYEHAFKMVQKISCLFQYRILVNVYTVPPLLLFLLLRESGRQFSTGKRVVFFSWLSFVALLAALFLFHCSGSHLSLDIAFCLRLSFKFHPRSCGFGA